MEKSATNFLWQIITSRKLALWLIVLLALFSVISMVIPQINYQSYTFLTITLLFSINLVCCTIKQISRIIKTRNQQNSAPKTKYNSLLTEVRVNNRSSNLKKEIVKILNQARYKVEEKNEIIIAEKGKLGIWGGPIFHVGLLVIILGGLITNYFSMSGYFKVSEGEVFQESHNSYVAGSLDEALFFREQHHPGYHLTLEKQERFFKGKLLDYTRSYVAIGDNSQELYRKGIIERGKPFTYQGLIFYHKDSGFSPELILRKNGQDIGSTFFSLNTSPIDAKGKFTYTGEFRNLEVDGYLIKLSFFPDMVKKGNNQLDYESMDLKNPAIYVEVFKYNQPIYKGLLKSGQWAKFDDFELSFGRIALWVGLDVVKDPGAQVLFLGFVISMLGLIILYGVVPKKIYLELKQDETGNWFQVSGYSRKYQLFFQDEYNQLIDRLRNVNESQRSIRNNQSSINNSL